MLPFMTTLINLEDIMLSAIRQTERQILHGITYMWVLKGKKVKLGRNRGGMMVARCNSVGKNRKKLVNTTNFQLLYDYYFYKWYISTV